MAGLELIYYFALGGAILVTAATCLLIRICLNQELRFVPLLFFAASVAYVLLARDRLDVFVVPIAARVILVNYLLFYLGFRPFRDRPSIQLIDCFVALGGIALLVGFFREPLVSLYEEDATFSLEIFGEAIAHCLEGITLIVALKITPTRAVRSALCLSGAFLIASTCLAVVIPVDWLFYAILRITWIATIPIVFRA